jgi:hypothetical protein
VDNPQPVKTTTPTSVPKSSASGINGGLVASITLGSLMIIAAVFYLVFWRRRTKTKPK